MGIRTTSPCGGPEIDSGAEDIPGLLNSTGPGWGSGLLLNNSHMYVTYSGEDDRGLFVDQDADIDGLTFDTDGNFAIGIGSGPAQRTLHVEGSEIHSSGPGGGVLLRHPRLHRVHRHLALG